MSTVWNDGDIPFLIQATGGVPCTIDGVEGFALADYSVQPQTGDGTQGEVLVGIPVLTIQSSGFPNAAVGSFVVIDGKFFTVRSRLPYGDGGNSQLFLGPASGTPPPPPSDIIDGGAFDGTGGLGRSPDGGGF